MVVTVVFADQVLRNSARLVQPDLEAVWVDVGDYGEVAVGAEGVVLVFVVDFVVAVGESIDYY